MYNPLENKTFLKFSSLLKNFNANYKYSLELKIKPKISNINPIILKSTSQEASLDITSDILNQLDLWVDSAMDELDLISEEEIEDFSSNQEESIEIYSFFIDDALDSFSNENDLEKISLAEDLTDSYQNNYSLGFRNFLLQKNKEIF